MAEFLKERSDVFIGQQSEGAVRALVIGLIYPPSLECHIHHPHRHHPVWGGGGGGDGAAEVVFMVFGRWMNTS